MSQGGRSITQSIRIKAPAATVFRALTDGDQLVRWMPSRAESDPRKGGTFNYKWEFPQAPENDHDQKGVYTEVAAPTTVRYPWHSDGEREPTEVRFSLAELDGVTTVELVHSGWMSTPSAGDSYDLHANGWKFFLGNLKAWLERGADDRPKALGMQTLAAKR